MHPVDRAEEHHGPRGASGVLQRIERPVSERVQPPPEGDTCYRHRREDEARAEQEARVSVSGTDQEQDADEDRHRCGRTQDIVGRLQRRVSAGPKTRRHDDHYVAIDAVTPQGCPDALIPDESAKGVANPVQGSVEAELIAGPHIGRIVRSCGYLYYSAKMIGRTNSKRRVWPTRGDDVHIHRRERRYGQQPVHGSGQA
jgi:hypothetical protein